MLLQDIFTASRIKYGLEAGDKDEIFEELVDVLVRGYNISNREEILHAIEDREAKMSTGIKTGIALPHGKVEGLAGICGALGVSESGIDYDSLDGEPVFLVILLVSGTENAEIHLKILKKIAELLENPAFLTDMKNSGSAEKAFSVLKNYENAMEKREMNER
ncbi:MAG: PTS sugar transporter subunit IIA [Spirochaetales bacterium]|jgi:PTS system fructose-specific IIC component/PTS system nitrogen regulatory IIA component|nr:PTS sugar transporter subunit IIA [Spirochaetales bacterium]